MTAIVKRVTISDLSLTLGESGEAGSTVEFTCPNCFNKVKWAVSMWWKAECECGRWDVNFAAVLDPKED